MELLKRASRRRKALQMGLSMALKEIPADEWEAMRIIDAEVSKFEEEQQRRQEH